MIQLMLKTQRALAGIDFERGKLSQQFAIVGRQTYFWPVNIVSTRGNFSHAKIQPEKGPAGACGIGPDGREAVGKAVRLVNWRRQRLFGSSSDRQRPPDRPAQAF